ncbi:MAG: gliding motility lipoprotein GldB [Flavobacteriaceae bacterium TMED171]|nr:gliding motility lipoprotein GldB [Flavobacteriaceae bacterium]OUW33531.1 MAG: gliding motility lipoprotein GldB [Flavobacteriaceae bacterium TMED171]
MRLIICSSLRIFFVLSFICFITGCKEPDSKISEILSIPLELTIERFDEKFHLSQASNIPQLKKEFPFLFPEKFNDSVWVKRQKDSLQLLLFENVNKKFPKIEPLENDLENLFKHFKYYFPKTQPPRVIGVINNVDYQSKTIYTDSLLIVSLDTYLGADHPLYEGIPQYIRQEMDIKYLSSHVVNKFVAYKIPPTNDRTLLSQMIYFGKQIYLKDWVMPKSSDALKMCYTEDQLQWLIENEVYMWQYFIEKQLLFNTDPSLLQRFIAPAPFSKFYLEIDNESPGRVGVWLGWQIIKSYMKRYPETEINALINLPAQTLFSKSNYKPRR